MRAWLPLLSACLLLALTGCDRAGIHPLGRLRDGLVPCEVDPLGRIDTTSTWVRSTAEGTEIILLGRPDPTTPVDFENAGCFARGFVAHDSSTRFEFGSYTLGVNGRGTAVRTVEYVFNFEPELSILSRIGSKRTDLPTPISEELSITEDGTQIIVGIGNDMMRLTSLGELIENLDTGSQEGAEDIFRVFNLPLFTSQARLLGFGGGAMTQYIPAPGTFQGVIRNRFTVSVEAALKPNTRILYYQFEDLTGIVVDGLQKTNVNTKGNGTMEGTLNFVMRGTGGATDVVIRGHLAYDDLVIGNGVASNGSYTLTFDGVNAEYVIPYSLATDVDLRNVLPVEAP